MKITIQSKNALMERPREKALQYGVEYLCDETYGNYIGKRDS